ncbi:M23 family metallopeptidase [Rhodococcus spelaei]|uniref:M23 family metallopeptidase n=1 Tax=Rhodococcus spelaei TaxID=2546320 RepID=UPI001FE663D5|nr:M23 family metallopeptidase [Rhodococcus spelaei]
MAIHHRTFNRSHALPTRLKLATVAVATGAILAGGAQLGAASASAAPLQVAPGVLPAGVVVPVIETPPGPAGQWLTDFVGSLGAGSVAPKALTVQPVAGTLSSGYGARWGTQHGGIDIAAPMGTPIKSAAAGEVISAGPASGFGQWVRVRHDDGVVTVYGHVETYLVSVGQRVEAGQQIATVGSRGESTGPHLHFETWDANGNRTNPSAWLADRGVGVTWGS